MKQEPGQPSVQVRVEVNVTLPGLGTTVKQVAGPQLASGTINVTIPSGNAQVWTNSSGNRFICARGTLSASAPTVYAKTYKGTGHVCPCDPPTTDTSCISTTPVLTSGTYNWSFDRSTALIPIQDCVMSGQSDPYLLVVWARFDGDTHYACKEQSFNAVCSTRTDCDSAFGDGGPLLAGAGYPVLADPQGAGPQPALVGHLRMKTGRFAALPEQVRLAWCRVQQGWTWTSEQAECGSYTVLPFKDWFLLHSTVSNPPLIPARPGGSRNPLHVVFEVTATDKSGEPEGFVLDVRQEGSPAPGAA
jgi:hypothetical protein